ncbi:hypothetical protein ACGFMM_01525 [Streptomyces sp. NPDC048604]|uniref:hypothetical protein n=1 Tax=Streptomyces sp. NPDC048604 TaxID=3365578 RepID=UPI00371FE68C
MNAFPTCLRCTYELRTDEQGRQLCFRCEDRTARHLAAIPGPHGLYAQLAHHLQRGGNSGGPAVSGSKTAPIPLRIDVVSLQAASGQVLGPLETWVRDWETYGHADLNEAGTLQQRVDHACRTLRYNLRWCAEVHPAADEFVREVGDITRTLAGITGGEKPPRKIPVACPCGNVIRTTLNTRGETCRGCRTEYGHSEVLRLPLADRRAAA